MRSANPNIPWKTLSGVRNRLIHHYFGVNIDIVWSIAKEDLPELHKNILRLTKELL
ncbi:MAG: HepT-like ribonuclease domain-containing protein [Candidatus Margulisiibacteriota bacterium]